ncbi:hypothetical protein [Dongia deserti]|uniref:hypothetical protein n=1 Tax=Dongia deserti TaxID=2268030 RepID=UPI000E651AEB|nr:hypothetical protein [Dongia deserti]
MTLALLLVVTIAVAECASHLPLLAISRRFAGIFPRALRTVRNAKASDHWKEMALLKLARLSLISSGCAAGAILGIVALFVGGIYVLDLVSPRLWELAMSIEGISIASAAAILYLAARSHARSLLQRR